MASGPAVREGASELRTAPGGDRAPLRGDGSAEESAALRRSRLVLTHLLGPPEERDFAVRYWTGEVERPDREPSFTLELSWPGALRHMLLPPTETSLGGGYVRGHYDVQGDMESAMALQPALRRRATAARTARLLPHLLALPRRRTDAGEETDRRGAPARSGRRHSPDRDASSVRYHYDLPSAFFELWLDPWMQYSSGYFRRGGQGLREAQEWSCPFSVDR